MRLAGGALDALFPPRCLLCEAFLQVGESGLCSVCRHGLLPLVEPLCPVCGAPSPLNEGPCPVCEDGPDTLRWVRAYGAYGGPLEHAIHRFKFEGVRALGRSLGDLLTRTALAGAAPADADLCLPVPLHPRRLRERGYNQALLLARVAARRWSVPLVRWGALRRARWTPPQSGLGAEERRQGLVGAFVAVPDRVEGRHILLVDDVVTTGSTLGEAARALLDAGATSVSALCLARALPEELIP